MADSASLTIRIEDDPTPAPPESGAAPPAPPPPPVTTPGAGGGTPPLPPPAGSIPSGSPVGSSPGTAPSPAGSVPSGPAGGTQFVDIRKVIDDFGGDLAEAAKAVRQMVAEVIAAGGKATAFYDDRAVEIASATADVMRDLRGAPLGVIPLAAGSPGTKTGIELTPGTSATPAPAGTVPSSPPAAAPEPAFPLPAGSPGPVTVVDVVADEVPTPASPAGSVPEGEPAAGTVPAFDRPFPVIVMGPVPLQVEVVRWAGGVPGGGPAGGEPKEKKSKEKEGPNWAERQFGRAGNIVDRLGDAGAGIADNRAGPAAGAAVDAAQNVLSAFGGPVGKAAAVGLGTLEKGFEAASDVVSAFVRRGKELSAYNGSLAVATAQADVRKFQTDMSEASQIGDKLAELIELQSKANAVVSETLIPIKSFLLDILNGAIDTALKILVEMLQALRDLLDFFGVAVPALDGVLKKIRDILAGAGKIDPLDVWLAAAAGFVGPAVPGRPGGPGGLGLPFFRPPE